MREKMSLSGTGGMGRSWAIRDTPNLSGVEQKTARAYVILREHSERRIWETLGPDLIGAQDDTRWSEKVNTKGEINEEDI